MVLNGFEIWLAALLATVGGIVLAAAHFLTVRRREVRVATVLFWQEAVRESRRNILSGRFGSVLTMLFLLMIVLALAFATARPVFRPAVQQVIIVDTGPATDLELAKKQARVWINRSDRCSLVAAGREFTVLSNMQSPRSETLAALKTLQADTSPYSGIEQAIRHAQSAERQAGIVVLTGQELPGLDHLRIVSCPAPNPSVSVVPIRVSVRGEPGMYAKLYCNADPRFEYCEDPNRADLVLEGLTAGDFARWHHPEFVEWFCGVLEEKAGLQYRHPVAAGQTQADPETPLHLPYGLWLPAGLFLCLLLETWLFKKGVIL
jgi:hypothetical protein